MKKKILAVVLCLALLAITVVGGTMAYFTDTGAKQNVFTVGNVSLQLNEEQRVYDEQTGKYDNSAVEPFQNDLALVPAVIVPEDGVYSYDGEVTLGNGKTYNIWDATINNERDKFVTVTNTGTEEAYVRVIFAFEDDAAGTVTQKLHTLWGDADGVYEEMICKPNAEGEYVGMESGEAIYWLQNTDGSWLTLDLEGNGSCYTVAVFTYRAFLEPEQTSDPSLMQLWLDPSATNAWSQAVGGQYNISVAALAVQADGFDAGSFADPASKAMDTAFDMTAANLLSWLTD